MRALAARALAGLVAAHGLVVSRGPSQRRRVVRLGADAVIDAAAVVEDAVGHEPYASVVPGVELSLERPLGPPDAYLVKARCGVPGAAVLFAFDEIKAKAKDNLAEPGFRPGDIPPWVKTQMVEFSLTTVMEDVVKFAVEANGMGILEDAGDGEDVIRWDEDPAVEAKSYVLGGAFTFHAAFNATLPSSPASEAMTVEDLYKITDADAARAAKIFANKGKVPNLMASGGSSKKKKRSKKKSR